MKKFQTKKTAASGSNNSNNNIKNNNNLHESNQGCSYYLFLVPGGCWRLLGQLLEPLEWNADWEGPDPDGPPAVLHQQPHPVNPAAQPALTTVNKVDAVVVDVKADQVAAEDALEDEVVPGEDFDHVPGGEGNVKEVADLA